MKCPECDAEVEEGAEECPVCGTSISGSKTVRCRVCGEEVPEDADVCPYCGTKFREEDIEKTKAPVVPFRKRRERKVVVGAPRKKEKKEEKEEVRVKLPKKKRKVVAKQLKRSYGVPAFLVILVLIIFAVGYFWNLVSMQAPKVDGEFEDWNSAVKYEDVPDRSLPSSIDIITYAVQQDSSDVFFYMKVYGSLFSNGSKVNIFVDADGDASTGYRVRGIGADLRIEATGAASGRYYQFSPGESQESWSGWSHSGTARCAASSGELECSVPLDRISDAASARVVFHTSGSGMQDYSEAAVGTLYGAVVVREVPVEQQLLQPGSEGVVLLRLEVEAKGTDNDLSTLTVKRLGTGVDDDASSLTLWRSNTALDTKKLSMGRAKFIPNLHLEEGEKAVLTVTANIWESAHGDSIGISAVEVETSRGFSTLLHGTPYTAYIGSYPDRVVPDGNPAEWPQTVIVPDGTDKDLPGDVDVMSFRGVVQDGSIAFYMELRGMPFQGSAVPVSGDSGMTEYCIYMDTDNNTTTGDSRGAEYRLCLRGMYSQIHHVSLSDYVQSTGSWDEISTGISAGAAGKGVEVSMDLAQVSGTPGRAVVVTYLCGGEMDSIELML